MNKPLISYSTERARPRGHVLQFNLVMQAHAMPKTKALECWLWPSPELAFHLAGPRWNWPDIMPQPLSFKHLPKGKGCQMHHNITLLRIHSQQSQVVSVILVVYLEAVWCREEKTGCRVKKIIKCNSRMKKKKYHRQYARSAKNKGLVWPPPLVENWNIHYLFYHFFKNNLLVSHRRYVQDQCLFGQKKK